MFYLSLKTNRTKNRKFRLILYDVKNPATMRKSKLFCVYVF